MRGLRSAAGWLRREVGRNVGLRYTPELILTLDDSISRGAHISKLLNEVMPAESGEQGENTIDDKDQHG